MAIWDKPKYTLIRIAKKKEIPDGLWVKCPSCGEIIFRKKLEENLRVCPKCDYHFTLSADERIKITLDSGTFEEMDRLLVSPDPLNFQGPKPYKQKLKEEQEKTKMLDAAITGKGRINSIEVIIGVTDSRFMMGSMGCVLGEKITRAIERSIEEKLPLIIISGSGGGARMQEGMLSLMQMAKTSGALAKLRSVKIPYISVITNPTMAGVLASFASLGDILIAEPRALIGFTGPRVIEQTIRQKLPPGFQTSEFLLQHGLIDMIVHRKKLKDTLALLIEFLS
ncbi:MAG: acetyl-CoA carboxylase carboxyl transferase subunit beta [Candidatus Omnitrophica bacterium 4484_49]|nr:MAG: acetyl-CoA carboxylase carboxyl transferase subunit beta [Candidatus Omnitrophica bacterium 4484_49]